MIKFILLLAIIAMGASAYFGYENWQKQTAAADAVTKLKSQVAKINSSLAAEKKDLEDLDEDLADNNDLISEAKAEKEVISTDITAIKREVDQAKANNNDLSFQITQFESQLPDDIPDPSDLEIRLNEMNQEIEEKEVRVEELKALVASNREKANNNQKVISSKRQQEGDRLRRIALNSRSARVSAADNANGFVVLNAPRSLGITPDSRLLAARNGRIVSRLKVSSIDPRQVVADILDPGNPVLPGDVVLVQDLAE